MRRLLISLILITAASHVSSAQEPVVPSSSGKDVLIKQFLVNAGAHTEFYNQVQVDNAGSLRKFEPAPVVGIGMVIPYTSEFSFLSELNWVLPRKAGEKIYKNLLMARADLGYKPIDWFQLRGGTSLMWLNQHGSGGSAKINNGNTTSTFYYPEENRSSYNTTLDLGVELLLSNFSLRLQTYTYAAFREERRKLSYSLFLSYYWDR